MRQINMQMLGNTNPGPGPVPTGNNPPQQLQGIAQQISSLPPGSPPPTGPGPGGELPSAGLALQAAQAQQLRGVGNGYGQGGRFGGPQPQMNWDQFKAAGMNGFGPRGRQPNQGQMMPGQPNGFQSMPVPPQPGMQMQNPGWLPGQTGAMTPLMQVRANAQYANQLPSEPGGQLASAGQQMPQLQPAGNPLATGFKPPTTMPNQAR